MEQVEKAPYVILGDEEKGYELVYMMDNEDPTQREILLSYLAENDCKIKNIIWRSKFDREVVETVEPKIYDAFYCVVSAVGKMCKLLNSLSLFHKRQEVVDYLEKCFTQGKEPIHKCVKDELENAPINYGKLANSIIASLSHP